jgi:hypothetical protein
VAPLHGLAMLFFFYFLISFIFDRNNIIVFSYYLRKNGRKLQIYIKSNIK